MSHNELCGLDVIGRGTYTAEGIEAIAGAIRVSGSLTVADLRLNELDTESATTLANIAKEKKISLCGITPDQTEANLQGEYGKQMGPADAILLTADLTVRGSLTAADLRYNRMGSEAERMLRDCVKDRPNFDLKL